MNGGSKLSDSLRNPQPTYKMQNVQTPSLESPSPTGYPSSWPVMKDGFPIIRNGGAFRCHGDPAMDELRIARVKLDRSGKDISKAVDAALMLCKRHFVGYFLQDLIEELDAHGADSFEPWQLFSKSRSVHDLVADAKRKASSEEPPPAATWETFSQLSVALQEHGMGLKQLRKAESWAKHSLDND